MVKKIDKIVTKRSDRFFGPQKLQFLDPLR